MLSRVIVLPVDMSVLAKHTGGEYVKNNVNIVPMA